MRLSYLNAGAAFDVIHPQLGAADWELSNASCNHVVSVWRPDRRSELALFVLAELFGIAAVGIGDPHVLRTAAIAAESNLLPVRRNIQREPRALIRREFDLAPRFERQRFFLLIFFHFRL